MPPSLLMVNSPSDREAHYAKKGTTSWVGYKVHLTESCEEGLSHWITHVETTAAPIADGDATDRIHRALQQDLLPSLHLVDTGYSDAALLVSSRQEYGVKLLGPTRADQHWQAKADQGFGAHRFRIDWEHKQATCPEGHTSASWTPALNRSRNPVIQIKFATADCGPCTRRSQCTHSTRARRTLTLLPRDQYLVLEQAQQREADGHFAQQYAQRAGIEGTLSQAIRAFELRRARYIGQAKTHLEHLATAAALNLVRVGMWLIGQPQAQTRHSSFVRLMTQRAPP